MAYALQPLICILEQQLDLDCDNITPQLETLLAKAKCLRDFVENTYLYKSSENKDLENRIRDASYEAEDVIETYLMDKDVETLPDLSHVMETFDMILENEEEKQEEENIPSKSYPIPISSQVKNAVGFEKELYFLQVIVSRDLNMKTSLMIIPIVGIGGSGKTLLAQMLYNDSVINSHFDQLGWTTISKNYNLKRNLLDLIRSLNMLGNKKLPNHMLNKDAIELGHYVYNYLQGTRYLIVVDDIWDMDAWDNIKLFFPDNGTNSRVIVTTREQTVADCTKTSSTSPIHVPSLHDWESWDLLKRKVFGRELCPPELFLIGHRIALNCRGHPLTLTTVAGHLSTLDRTVDVWRNFEQHQLDSIGKGEVDSDINDPVMVAIVDLCIKDGQQLLEPLRGQQPKLKITPIVGMRGSGKTTMARLLYNRLLHAGRFDVHAWVTSSEHKNVRDILRNLLDSFGEGTNERLYVNDDEVGDHIYKTLYQRRYLVVLDNIKDVNNWGMLKRFFPDTNNGSRIILTARESGVADYDKITPFHLNSYWEYLLQQTFEQYFISTGLEEKTRIFWKLIEEKQSSGEGKHDPQFDSISMSYNNLPCHLKPCFLYMGAFPEDYEIKVSKIINLWIAEGFVKLTEFKSFESAAEEYLKALLDRNLLIDSRWDLTGKVEAIRIHDIFWKFCRKKAFEENFMWCKDSEVQNTPENEEEVRRVSVHSLSEDSDWMNLYWARSLLCVGSVSQDLAPIILELRLLRVLDVLQFVSAEFPEEMLQMLNLRYLALTCLSHIPSSISDLQHLQTFIVPGASSLPSELWALKQLRHINCKQTRTWSVPEENGDSSFVVQENLHTLSNVPLSVMSEVFLRKIPNIRKLRIFCDVMINAWVCLDRLHILESLKCSSADGSPDTRNFLSYLLFPFSLKKLTLRSCEISTKDIYRIAMLPCLEQLKLQKCGFMHRVWDADDGVFRNLRVLHVEDSNLVEVHAEDIHFPRLERLIIRGCHSMQEIPYDFGDIPTLYLIEVSDCLPSLVKSALAILDEQLEFGNDQLRVSILNTRTD